MAKLVEKCVKFLNLFDEDLYVYMAFANKYNNF